MAIRISVFDSDELAGVILAMKGLDRETAKQLRSHTKTMVQGVWTEAVAGHAHTRLEHAVLASTARAAVSDQNVTLKAASVGRALKGGMRPSDYWQAVEFGADRSKTTTYTATSRSGKAFKVTRHTRAQLRPANRQGYVVYPAAAGVIPRIASLWVQTIVRTFHEQIEKGA